MTMKHTPGPWFEHNLAIGDGARGPFTYPLGRDAETAAANASRIVACVNACEGLADPGAAIKALRASLAETLRALETHLTDAAVQHGLKAVSGLCPCWDGEVQRARSALAPFAGRGTP